MVASVTGADPQGIYVMQGWLFRFSSFWTLPNAQAFLSGLPVNQSLILGAWGRAGVKQVPKLGRVTVAGVVLSMSAE